MIIMRKNNNTLLAFSFWKAEEVLRHERHSWLLNHILYLEIEELLLDYEIRSQDVSLSSRDQQVVDSL